MEQKYLLIFEWNLKNGFYKDFIYIQRLIILNISPKSNAAFYLPSQRLNKGFTR